MADRSDFYFRQKVTEAELDGEFDNMETADFDQMIDTDLVGVLSGLVVAENGVPDLTVDVPLGTAYSKQGERIRVGSTQDVDVSQDENTTSTSVAGAPNSKVISVYIEFDRSLTDPRTDGNDATVFFSRAETFRFIVRQGAEAATPGGGAESAFITANASPLDVDLILLADIIRDFGQVTVLTADIFTFRTENTFKLSTANITIDGGTPEDALQQVLQELENHVAGVANAHLADAIDFDPAGLPIPAAWTDVAAATDVQGALNGVVNDLAQIDGSELVGAGVATTWADAASPSGTTVDAVLESIVGDLADATGPDGAGRVGYDPAGAAGLSAVTVAAALDELDSEIIRIADNAIWTGNHTFTGNMELRNGDTAAFGTDWMHSFNTESVQQVGIGTNTVDLWFPAAEDIAMLDIWIMAVNDSNVNDWAAWHWMVSARRSAGVVTVTVLEDAGAVDVTDNAGNTLNLITDIVVSGTVVRAEMTSDNANTWNMAVYYQILELPSNQ